MTEKTYTRLVTKEILSLSNLWNFSQVLVIQQHKFPWGTPGFGKVMNPDQDANAVMLKMA